MTTNYRRYSNAELREMIQYLKENGGLSKWDEDNFTWSIFQRYHNSKYDTDEERKEAQRKNALQYYWRKKLINTYNDLINRNNTCNDVNNDEN